MSASRIRSTTQFQPIPLIIKNSFRWIERCPKIPSTISSAPRGSRGSSILATNLIKSYFENGMIEEARIVFDEMHEKDVVAWTAMIAGYTSCNHNVLAWTTFCDMIKSENDPNDFTVSSVLKTCKGMKALSTGALVHGLAVKKGIHGSVYVDNALLDLYATCCTTMDDACRVFQDIDVKNAVSWTTLITGFTHKGYGYAGLQVFKKMLQEDAELNPFSFSIAVRACTSIGSHTSGKQIHAEITKIGLESNLPVMNSILDMYCRCDHLSDAHRCFNEMSEKDLITWNTLIAGYEKPDPSESLHIFSLMESEGCTPNCFTFTSVIAACSNLAVLVCGQQVHGGVVRKGLDKNLALANSLIDMYAKCGNVNDAHKIFSELSCRDLVSWTTMMIGYGTHGCGKETVKLFDEMVESGIWPDRIVFVAVLSACSHAGLVDEGLGYFKLMMGKYNVAPNPEIYGCVVDLLGRAGRVVEAYQLIKSMPFKPDESVWGALLGACKAHSIPNLGKLAFQKVLDLRPKNRVGTYVMLSNIYAAEGKWGEFANMRKLMRGMEKKKEAGRSWIELKDRVYSFVVGDKMGSHIKRVYGVLNLLTWHMKDVCYVHDLDSLASDDEDGT